MSDCLLCGKNKATICIPCINEIAEPRLSAEWNAAVEALVKLYKSWAMRGPDDSRTQERMIELMRIYDDWLG
jgi:hypothetical protein